MIGPLTSVSPALAINLIECGEQAIAGRGNSSPCRVVATDGRDANWSGLVVQLAHAPLVLLGEVHDNATHHRLRAALISELASRTKQFLHIPAHRSRPPALVFEHIRGDQGDAIEAYNRDILASLNEDHLRATLNRIETGLEWGKSGWPAFELFKPLFKWGAQGRHQIYPGDPSRNDVRRVAREGPPALSESERQRLKLDAPLSPPLQDALLSELEASHCGLMPKTAFGNMATAQRYRDAHLAAALVSAAKVHGRAILLAGNGHVRSDRGVPYYLRAMAPGKKIASVLFLEVEDGKTDPAAYVPLDPDGRPAADYIVLTPRAERPDPCVEMKRRFAKPRP